MCARAWTYILFSSAALLEDNTFRDQCRITKLQPKHAFISCRAETVVGRVGAENRDEVLATTILAYALSTIMTGAVFMALGYFKVNPFLLLCTSL